MFYLCKECNSTFDYPKIEYRGTEYGITPHTFEVYVCPECGSENFIEVEACKECNKIIVEGKNDCGGICDECVHENCNLPIVVFDFCNDSEPEKINDFAIKCLGAKGINEILRDYFKEISETDYSRFEKEREAYIEKYIDEIGEWLSKNEKT